MFGLDPDTTRNIKQAFAKIPEIDKVVLYGSRAKGNYRNGSDIDITLFGENLSLSNSVYSLMDKLEELYLPYMFDISIFSDIDNEDLIQHINRVGKVFYRKEKGLPDGWEVKRLGEVCEVFTDGNWIESKDQSTEGIRLIQTGNIGFGFYKDKKNKARFISEETFVKLKCTEILPNDLLISRLPDPVGKSCIIPDINSKMITGVDCTIVRTNDNLMPELLLFYQMSKQYLDDVKLKITGTTRNRISRKNLGLIKIPLPPLPEQKRIVALLDQAFTAINKAKANTEQNLKNARELFESYLQNVFENKGDDWGEKRIDEITTVVNGHSFKSKDFSSKHTVKSIKITNVGVKEFITTEDSYLPSLYSEIYNNHKVFKGSIVIALTRTIISSGLKIAVVPEEYNNSLLNQRVAALIPKEVINDDYLYHFLCTGIVSDYVLSNVNTLMQPNFSINDLKKLLVPFPSIDKQRKIVQKLNHLSTETKKLKTLYQQKITNLDELKKSLLQKAFSGEL